LRRKKYNTLCILVSGYTEDGYFVC